jgi:hypothetical protein
MRGGLGYPAFPTRRSSQYAHDRARGQKLEWQPDDFSEKRFMGNL